MDNRIEKIRAEVDRLHSKWMLISTTEGYYKCKLCNQLLKFIDSLQEEPVSNDLKKFAEEWDESLYRSDAVIAGAKWQKEQFEKDYTDLCKGIVTAKGLAVTMAYEKGIADAREQMMKNAVEGELRRGRIVAKDIQPLHIGLNADSKFKLIIVKEK